MWWAPVTFRVIQTCPARRTLSMVRNTWFQVRSGQSPDRLLQRAVPPEPLEGVAHLLDCSLNSHADTFVGGAQKKDE